MENQRKMGKKEAGWFVFGRALCTQAASYVGPQCGINNRQLLLTYVRVDNLTGIHTQVLGCRVMSPPWNESFGPSCCNYRIYCTVLM